MTPSSMTGRQLIEWREKLGLSQERASALIGICLASLKNYECGRRADTKSRVVIPLVVAWAVAGISAGLRPAGSPPRPTGVRP